jgi:hypothetical protein
MRRFVSIVFIVLCGLGPLSALVPGSDESQLPACCRRHGAHHCAMTTAADQASSHVVSAPSRCPQYHRSFPANRGAFALPASPAAAHTAAAELVIAAAQTAGLHQTRANTNRGPPALL